MKVISGERGSGKTTELVKMAAEYGAVLVCGDNRRVRFVKDVAKSLGLRIKDPIKHRKFITGGFHGRGLGGYMIDDLDLMLAGVACGGTVSAVAVGV